MLLVPCRRPRLNLAAAKSLGIVTRHGTVNLTEFGMNLCNFLPLEELQAAALDRVYLP
jgi:hypothetical protein